MRAGGALTRRAGAVSRNHARAVERIASASRLSDTGNQALPANAAGGRPSTIAEVKKSGRAKYRNRALGGASRYRPFRRA